jgi:preprotein translocase subunit YajC
VLGNVYVQAPLAVAPAAQQQGGEGGLLSLLPMLVIFGLIFYFFIIRPQRTRQRKMLEMQNSLVPGQRVMTVAGLYATVSAIEEDAVVLEIAPGVESRYTKQAVSQILDTSTTDEDEDEEDEVTEEESDTVDGAGAEEAGTEETEREATGKGKSSSSAEGKSSA